MRIIFIRSQCVNKVSQDFRYYQDRHFRTQVLSECRKNPIKPLLCRFQEYLGPFNMLTVLWCTEMWLFSHLQNQVFCSLQFRKYISYEAQFFFFFLKCWNLHGDFTKAVKNSEKIFSFLDIWIWICCIKFFHLWKKNTCHREPIC